MIQTSRPKHRRKRGVILTPRGLQKLQTARTEAETQQNSGQRYTLEDLSELTELSVDTVMKVLACEVGVDRQTLKCFFQAFKLSLELSDFTRPTPPVTAGLGSEATSPSPAQLDRHALLESLCYVERNPLETICAETLRQPGALLRIKAPHLMGKTSLLIWILVQAAQVGYDSTSLSFQLADRRTHFTHLDKCLRWLCINLSRDLGLPNRLEDYWDEEGMGSKVSCTTYFEAYLLAQTSRPLVLCLDDVDLLFPYPEVYEDLFGLLRSWHEKAKIQPRWQQLRLVIAHATDVYIRLNINQSPFNVGVPIELSEFSVEQVLALIDKHGLAIEPTQVKSIMQWVGGHPYLLQQAFTYLKTHPDLTLTALLAEAATETGIYQHHLRKHWLDLYQHPELAAAFKQVVISKSPVLLDPTPAYQLQSMGLVKLFGNQAEPRCYLYRRYFAERLMQ